MTKKLSEILENNKTKIYTKKSKEQRLGDAPLDPKDQVKLGGKTEVGLNPTITGQQPFSQSTLHPQAMPHDAIEKLIDAYSKINAEHRRGFIDYLQKALDDSAWAKDGAGVPPETAKKNRAKLHYNKEEAEAFLSEQLEDIGFSEENQKRVQELFLEAVVRRVNEELAIQQDQPHPFRQRLMELLANYSPHPFNPEEKISVMEKLALTIENLEGHLELIEAQNQKLRQENYLREEQLFLKSETVRTPRKSSLEETMLTPDEANADAFFNTNEEKLINFGVRRYLNSEGKLWGL